MRERHISLLFILSFLTSHTVCVNIHHAATQRIPALHSTRDFHPETYVSFKTSCERDSLDKTSSLWCPQFKHPSTFQSTDENS
ncbi:hypothetical protein EV126DRAFT_429962 [Verticillium dahliae]|nr:hypothetical protein EV126DRAFT_429962 [Verticillium dahliae]